MSGRFPSSPGPALFLLMGFSVVIMFVGYDNDSNLAIAAGALLMARVLWMGHKAFRVDDW